MKHLNCLCSTVNSETNQLYAEVRICGKCFSTCLDQVKNNISRTSDIGTLLIPTPDEERKST